MDGLVAIFCRSCSANYHVLKRKTRQCCPTNHVLTGCSCLPLSVRLQCMRSLPCRDWRDNNRKPASSNIKISGRFYPFLPRFHSDQTSKTYTIALTVSTSKFLLSLFHCSSFADDVVKGTERKECPSKWSLRV